MNPISGRRRRRKNERERNNETEFPFAGDWKTNLTLVIKLVLNNPPTSLSMLDKLLGGGHHAGS